MPDDTPYTPDPPPAWLAQAEAAPTHYRLDLSLSAERYQQLLGLARGDAAEAVRIAEAMLSDAIVDDPAELRQALDDTDAELRAAEARCTELAELLRAALEDEHA